MKTHDERVTLSMLLHEIKDKSLHNILRSHLLGGDDLDKCIKRERPETK